MFSNAVQSVWYGGAARSNGEGVGVKKEILDLNIPKDARKFITEALPDCLPSKPIFAILADGSKIDLKNLTDSQAVQYAWELLPFFQAKYPEQVNVEYEQ